MKESKRNDIRILELEKNYFFKFRPREEKPCSKYVYRYSGGWNGVKSFTFLPFRKLISTTASNIINLMFTTTTSLQCPLARSVPPSKDQTINLSNFH